MFKVTNFWSLGGAILVALTIANVISGGKTSVDLAKGVEQTTVDTLKALRV